MDKKLNFKVYEDDKEVSYEEVYSFKYNDKNYMIYTDNTYDEDESLKLYAAIYDKGNKKLIPITDDDAWQIVSKKIEELENV